MVLTEKVRAKLGGGENGLMVVYYVSELAAGANNISAPAIGMNKIVHSDFWPESMTMSTDAESADCIMSTFDGDTVAVTCSQPGDSGTLMAWGH
ncbi:MAG: hypothetical protein ABIB65_01505 [Candidatus Margulisiibacteriota bacterium]